MTQFFGLTLSTDEPPQVHINHLIIVSVSFSSNTLLASSSKSVLRDPPYPIITNIITLRYHRPQGFPGGSVVMNMPANAEENRLNPLEGKTPWRRKW